LFGVALGRVYLFGEPLSPRLHLGMSITGLIALMLVFGIGAELPWLRNDAVLVVLFGLLIFGGAKPFAIIEQVIACPFLVLLGESSYGIYILQSPVAFWREKVTNNVLGLKLTPTFDFYSYFILLCTISILSFLYFETPLRRKLLGRREHKPA
jgi:peptidoglycan/LPS O-acetylase OafA/YrhL